MRVLQSTHHAVANHGGNRTHIVYAPVAHGFESQRFAVAFEWGTGNHLTEAIDSTLTPIGTVSGGPETPNAPTLAVSDTTPTSAMITLPNGRRARSLFEGPLCVSSAPPLAKKGKDKGKDIWDDMFY